MPIGSVLTTKLHRPSAATDLVVRHELAAGEEWRRIQRLTGMLPRGAIERNVELSLSEAWPTPAFTSVSSRNIWQSSDRKMSNRPA